MKNRSILIFTLIICCLASSCVKEKLETIYQKQESQIDSYLSKNNTAKRDSTIIYEDGTKKDTTWTEELQIVYNRGAARLVKKKGSGPKLAADGAVSFYYAGYTFNGSFSASNLFVTNHQATAEQAGWNLTDADYQIYEISMNDAKLTQGLRDGLLGVKAGEECEIVFSAKYGFGNKPLGMIPAKTALLYKIWVVGVTND